MINHYPEIMQLLPNPEENWSIENQKLYLKLKKRTITYFISQKCSQNENEIRTIARF